MATPSADEAQAALSIPHDAAYDWFTWASRGALIFVLGFVLKLYRDVQSLLTTRAQAEALAPIRDAQRQEILELVRGIKSDLVEEIKDHRDELRSLGQRVAHIEGERNGEHL